MFEIREELCASVLALVLGGLLATGCVDNSGNKTYPRGDDAAADMDASDDAPADGDVPVTGDAAPASDAPAGDSAAAADTGPTDAANDRAASDARGADVSSLDVRLDVGTGG